MRYIFSIVVTLNFPVFVKQYYREMKFYSSPKGLIEEGN